MSKLNTKISMRDIKILLTLIDNKFVVANAALDLGLASGVVSTAITRLITLFPKDFFEFAGNPTKRRSNVVQINWRYRGVIYQMRIVSKEYDTMYSVLES